MTNEEFEIVLKNSILNIQQTLGNKAKEYASRKDRLHNFGKAKEIYRCETREYALLGMLNKHLVSVIDMILNYEKCGFLPSKELIKEKIGDSINYLILLEALFLEDISKEVKHG